MGRGEEMIRLTETQKGAIRRLLEIPDGHWKQFMYGYGKYRVALRAIAFREPGMIEIDGTGPLEKYRLTDNGRRTFNESGLG